MRHRYLQYLVFSNLLLLYISCEPSGNLFLTNGYEQDVIVHAVYEYNGLTRERSDIFYQGRTVAVAARGYVEYSRINSILLKTLDDVVLAEYSLEYLTQLRKAYGKRKNQHEAWIFTEKGLFLETIDIERRFKFDSERILEYYRSDEAINDAPKV
jgi:hypothetical protein